MIRKSATLKERLTAAPGAYVAIFGGTSAAVFYPNGPHENVAMNAFRALRASGFLKSYVHEYAPHNRQLRYIPA